MQVSRQVPLNFSGVFEVDCNKHSITAWAVGTVRPKSAGKCRGSISAMARGVTDAPGKGLVLGCEFGADLPSIGKLLQSTKTSHKLWLR